MRRTTLYPGASHRAGGARCRVGVICVMLLASPAALAQLPAGCTDFGWNMTRELDLFKTPAVRVAAALEAGSAPVLHAGGLYELTLARQSAVRFSAEPQARRVVDDPHAGLALLEIPITGHYRLSANGPVWIDAVAGAVPIPANAFNGHARCPLIHKSVDFTLPAGLVLVQLSQSPAASIRIALTASPETSPP